MSKKLNIQIPSYIKNKEITGNIIDELNNINLNNKIIKNKTTISTTKNELSQEINKEYKSLLKSINDSKDELLSVIQLTPKSNSNSIKLLKIELINTKSKLLYSETKLRIYDNILNTTNTIINQDSNLSKDKLKELYLHHSHIFKTSLNSNFNNDFNSDSTYKENELKLINNIDCAITDSMQSISKFIDNNKTNNEELLELREKLCLNLQNLLNYYCFNENCSFKCNSLFNLSEGSSAEESETVIKESINNLIGKSSLNSKIKAVGEGLIKDKVTSIHKSIRKSLLPNKILSNNSIIQVETRIESLMRFYENELHTKNQHICILQGLISIYKENLKSKSNDYSKLINNYISSTDISIVNDLLILIMNNTNPVVITACLANNYQKLNSLSYNFEQLKLSVK